jgi:ribosomal protein S18 acetylase RimI-like enzyme
MRWDDIPEILWIARQPPRSSWIRPDFLTVFQSNETIGHVAEIQKRIAGFVLCSIERAKPMDANGDAFLFRALRWLKEGGRRRPRHIGLFGLAVVSGSPQASVEKVLLAEIVREFGRSAESIQAVAPETRLAAQLFLRDAGFQANRISKRYYGLEDGYSMVRPSNPLQTKAPAADHEQYTTHGICSNGEGRD